MRRIPSVRRARTCAVGALVAVLVAPWPGSPGDLTGQRRPSPAGAVVPHVASPAIDSTLAMRARTASITWVGARVRAVPDARAVAPRRRHRDPFLAGVLGAAIPGLGHAYAGEPRRGLTVFVLTEGALVTALRSENPTVGGIGATVGFGGYVFSILDAPVAASRYNQRHEPRPTPRPIQ